MRTWQHLAVLAVSSYVQLYCTQSVYRCSITARAERKELKFLFLREILIYDFPQPLSLGTFLSIAFNESAIPLPCMEVKYP